MAGTRPYTTLRRKKRFLDAFRRIGVVAYAATAARTDRSVVYDWRRDDPDFAIAFAQAEVESTERLEAEAVRRATRRVEPSDTLLIFLLKARRPEVYRDRVDVRARVEATLDATVTHLEAVRAHVQEADVERLTRALLGTDDGN